MGRNKGDGHWYLLFKNFIEVLDCKFKKDTKIKNKSIKNQAPSCGESKLFFALNIGKCHLKKNYEEKVILTFHFLERKK